MYFKENIFSFIIIIPAITVTIFITTTPLVITIIYGILVEYKHNMATPVLIHVPSMSILCVLHTATMTVIQPDQSLFDVHHTKCNNFSFLYIIQCFQSSS